jgi:hypothetical protein
MLTRNSTSHRKPVEGKFSTRFILFKVHRQCHKKNGLLAVEGTISVTIFPMKSGWIA